MKYWPSKLSLLLICLFVSFNFATHGQANGQTLFQNNCGSCHGLKEGAFGPKLGGITQTRSKKELYEFTKNPNAFIDKGDVRTKALFEKYKSVMPGFPHLKRSEIIAIFDYIEKQSMAQKIEPLSLESVLSGNTKKRYAPPVKPSNLYIELEDYVKIERTAEHLDDKGVTTMRSMTLGVFVSDQMGKIFRINNRKPEVYFDVKKEFPDFIIFPSIGAGLGSFAFHPDFENNGLLYTSHLEKYRGKPAINEGDWPDSLNSEQQYVITEWKTQNPARFPFDGTKREVLRINNPTFAHSGQDLTFAPGLPKTNPDYGMLYYTFGDGGSANIKKPELSHHLHSILGSILRIDPKGSNGVLKSYGIPPDNPYANATDPQVQKEIYANGFRNPYRLAWDEKRNHAMYVADIGEANVEELNLVKKGGDYGWANQEGSYGIDVRVDKTILFDRPDKGINSSILPLVTFDHSDGNAISGGYIYDGKLKVLKDKYIFGDIVSGRLFFTNVNDFSKGIFDIHIIRNGKETTMAELCGKKRTHLRVGYDRIGNDIYIFTKPDNVVRRVTKAYFK